MQVLFAVIIFICMLIAGMTGIVVGIIGLIHCNRRKKAGKAPIKPLTVFSATIVTISFLVTLAPASFFTFIVLQNILPPPEYVETDIAIEENGYQDTRFTAAGVVYERLDISLDSSYELTNPVFSYKTKGLLNGDECGNYYAVENKQGFTIVAGGIDSLFAPAEEKEKIIAYYSNPENQKAYYDDWNNRKFKLSEEDNEMIHNFINTDLSSFEKTRLYLTQDEEDMFEISLLCDEGIIYIESHWFLFWEGSLYYKFYDDTEPDTMPEYIPEEELDAPILIHDVIKLPPDIAAPILDIHKDK